ncbi:MAG: hypothetical protein KVP17_000530 [Porospora cf. gigantea B]|uniref:uncharacterized protein n=1 Tax=Porospora cf. gigantea B TaxID=2853592 RepID=UPI003571C5C2|nr:MAG: hypothetical protein KVP17_000530 [Porospora cf. gigantea B]
MPNAIRFHNLPEGSERETVRKVSPTKSRLNQACEEVEVEVISVRITELPLGQFVARGSAMVDICPGKRCLSDIVKSLASLASHEFWVAAMDNCVVKSRRVTTYRVNGLSLGYVPNAKTFVQSASPHSAFIGHITVRVNVDRSTIDIEFRKLGYELLDDLLGLSGTDEHPDVLRLQFTIGTLTGFAVCDAESHSVYLSGLHAPQIAMGTASRVEKKTMWKPCSCDALGGVPVFRLVVLKDLDAFTRTLNAAGLTVLFRNMNNHALKPLSCRSLPAGDAQFASTVAEALTHPQHWCGLQRTLGLTFCQFYALLCINSEMRMQATVLFSRSLIEWLKTIDHHPGALISWLRGYLHQHVLPTTDSVTAVLEKAAEAPDVGSSEVVTSNPSRRGVGAPLFALRAMVITPSRMVFMEPQRTLSNRVLNEFCKESTNGFLSVRIRDENCVRPAPEIATRAKLNQLFQEGLTIGDTHFTILHWSNSQLRQQGFYMYTQMPNAPSADDIRQWIMSQTMLKTPCKYATRLALFFSTSRPTITIPPAEVAVVPDVERNGFVFTDGCGRITLEASERVRDALGLVYRPSAYQFRFQGAKGVVVTAPSDVELSEGKTLEMRPSMVKFESLHDSFEVVTWSKFRPGRLNREIITLLMTTGVPLQTILGFMRKSIVDTGRSLTDKKSAGRRLRHLPLGPDRFNAMNLVDAGFALVDDAYFVGALQYLYHGSVHHGRSKSFVPIANSAMLFGIPDFDNNLEENEVFVQTKERQEEARVIVGNVLVTRNPCLHPGDLRVLRAVDIPSLRHIQNCVVFSVRGPRPVPDQMAGGDLDGDTYFVTWDSLLVQPVETCAAMDYKPDAVAVAEMNTDPDSVRKSMQEYFMACVTSTDLGTISNAHIILADKEGANSDSCLMLAKLHSDAVDAPKTGVKAKLPGDLAPNYYPTWMEKEFDTKETRHEDTPLQAIHDVFPSPAMSTAAVLDVTLDPTLLIQGHEQFLPDMKLLRLNYNHSLLGLMRRFGSKTEIALLTGPTESRKVSSADDEHERSTKALMKFFRNKILEKVEDQLDIEVDEAPNPDRPSAQLRVASACYVATYSNPDFNGIRMLSFGWLCAEEITQVLLTNSPPPRPVLLHKSLSDSLRTLFDENRQSTGGSAEAVRASVEAALQTACGPCTVKFRDDSLLHLSETGDPVLLEHTSEASIGDVAAALHGVTSANSVIGSVRGVEFVLCTPGSRCGLSTEDLSDLCGWLKVHPQLLYVLFGLKLWCNTHSYQTQFESHAAWSLLLEQLIVFFKSVDPINPDEWREAWSETDLDRSTSLNPGEVFHKFFLCQSQSGTLSKNVDVEILRAYQQVCLDGHVDSVTTNDVNSPYVRKFIFRVKSVQVDDVDVDALLESAEAAMVAACLIANHNRTERKKLRVDLQEFEDGRLCTIILVVWGTEEEIEACKGVVDAYQHELSQKKLKNWAEKGVYKMMDEKYRNRLTAALQEKQVIIVVGPTGCGKSTVIPLLMLMDESQPGVKNVICTQPRRVGATSLAARVAHMCGSSVGEEVGYAIGGMKESSEATRLRFLTNGVAVTLFLKGDSSCTHLIIDEVHCRSVFDDLLMAIVKHHLMLDKPNLKILLMSAATSVQTLKDYFGHENCTDVVIGEAPHDIVDLYLDDLPECVTEGSRNKEPSDKGVAELIWYEHMQKLCAGENPKPFLVFLPGKGEILRVRAHLYDKMDSLLHEGVDYTPIDLKVLHALIPVEKQNAVLSAQTNPKHRVVILSTDIVESSVTIPEVSLIIDCMTQKRKQWNETRQEYQLSKQRITKDEALQRAGRTGRTGPGVVCRLLTKKDYEDRPQHVTPLMKSASMADVLMMLYDSKLITKPLTFLRKSLLSPPDRFQVDEAYSRLQEVQALRIEFKNTPQQTVKLTRFGRLLQRLMFDAEAGMLVWYGLHFGVGDDAIILSAIVQRNMPWLDDQSGSPQEALQLVRVRRLLCTDSDLICAMRAYKAWQAFLQKQTADPDRRVDPVSLAEDELDWCWNHFLSNNKLQEIEETVLRIKDVLDESGRSPWPAVANEVRWNARDRRRAHRSALPPYQRQISRIEDPASSLRDLIGEFEYTDDMRALFWVIAVSYCPNACLAPRNTATMCTYSCRKNRQADLETFLRRKLCLDGAKVTHEKNTRTKVEFASLEDMQVAVQVGLTTGATYPYSHPPSALVSNTSRGCFSWAGDATLPNESVCQPVVRPSLVAIGATSMVVGDSNTIFG